MKQEHDSDNIAYDDDDWVDAAVVVGKDGFIDSATTDDIELDRRRRQEKVEETIPRHEDLWETVSEDPARRRTTRRRHSDRAPALSASERKMAQMLSGLVDEIRIRYGLPDTNAVYELCRNELADILVRSETEPSSVSPEAIASVLKSKLGR